MPQHGQLAYILTLSGGSVNYPDQGLPPGQPPSIDNTLPPLPPLPPGMPPLPDNSLPPAGARPSNPIFIPVPPNSTLPIPPGTIWPPLNPGDGVQGPGLLLVIVLGADGGPKVKWIAVEAPGISGPPSATPK